MYTTSTEWILYLSVVGFSLSGKDLSSNPSACTQVCARMLAAMMYIMWIFWSCMTHILMCMWRSSNLWTNEANESFDRLFGLLRFTGNQVELLLLRTRGSVIQFKRQKQWLSVVLVRDLASGCIIITRMLYGKNCSIYHCVQFWPQVFIKTGALHVTEIKVMIWPCKACVKQLCF